MRGRNAGGRQRPFPGPIARAQDTAPRLCNLALEHQAAGRLAEAERCFRGALDADPHHAESLNGLGIVAHQVGDSAAAVELIGEAITANGRVAPYHYNLGLVLTALGRTAEAVQHYRRAVALKPDYADAHTNLAAALVELGQLKDAALHFRRALSRRPDQPSAYGNLVLVLLSDGNAGDALDVVVLGLGVKETDELKQCFGIAIEQLQAPPKISGLRRLILRALLERWHRPEMFARHATAFVKESPAVAPLMARMGRGPPGTVPADPFKAQDLIALAGDELLRALLSSAVVRDAALQRLLTKARTAALDTAKGAASPTVDGIVEFCAALAQQCFSNEYIYAVADDELVSVGDLRDTLLASLRSGDDVPPLTVAVVAAYVPLHSLDIPPDRWSRAWPDGVGALIRQQIAEPAQEMALRQSIPALTPIASGVSELVRQQYEENPYPRWTDASLFSDPQPIDTRLKSGFPKVEFTPLGKTDVDILIAGCGTGRHAIDSARLFAGANVLAVDLSLASLAYAKRKAAEACVSNIEFAQADILNLGGIGRTFDVIESVGVLHHMRDWREGWRRLLPLLRPGGFMRIGLYSELARKDIVALRTLIAERGHSPTADVIRRFRQEILAADDGAPGNSLALLEDVHSLSGCRDLMFHVQETRTSIPEIKEFLAENRLSLIGFAGSARLRYAKAYPADQTLTDLDNWHALEQQNPGMFMGMYQFWVQKR
ncbi:MAG: tetratricopeptide repeat protein [Xanthobacteraceae bacterium]|nr:tetratricopeptide repeat protein [Xanthobacteraceae bacterium]